LFSEVEEKGKEKLPGKKKEEIMLGNEGGLVLPFLLLLVDLSLV